MEGTVERWLDMKGYGFIKTDDGESIFVHNSELQSEGSFKSLKSGQKVKFDVEQTPKGKSAKNVIVIEESEESQPSD